MTNDNLRNQEELETRNALLNYYSSQSREHVSYLLAMALVLFAAIQVVTTFLPTSRLIGLALGLFSFFMWRTFFRTLYWGYLASAIIVADEKKLVPDDSPADEFEDKRLKVRRLHVAAVHYVLKKHRGVASLAGSEGWAISAMLAIGIFFAFLYGYYYLARYFLINPFPI